MSVLGNLLNSKSFLRKKAGLVAAFRPSVAIGSETRRPRLAVGPRQE
jgi:hypothetical protein